MPKGLLREIKVLWQFLKPLIVIKINLNIQIRMILIFYYLPKRFYGQKKMWLMSLKKSLENEI